MSEERLMILKLLEEGKITEKEAEMLLNALGEEEYEQFTKDTHHRHERDDFSFRDFIKDEDENLERKLENLGKKVESLGSELENKFEGFGENLGKRMSDLGNEIADKSVDFAEKLVGVIGNLVENGNFKGFYWDPGNRHRSYEETIERDISDIRDLSLIFKAINGKITINQWDRNQIQVKAFIKADAESYESAHPILEVKESEGSLAFAYKNLEKLGLQLQVNLPNRAYKTITAETVNSSIIIERLQCERLSCRTKNSSIQLHSVKSSEEIGCTSVNGKIVLDGIVGNKLWAATKNGKITLSNVEATQIDLLSSNAKITAEHLNYKTLNSFKMKTSNGGIYISDPLPPRQVNFDLLTSNGKIELPSSVEYSENIKSHSTAKVIALYKHEDTLNEPLQLKAYTTNANIVLF